MDWLTNPNVAPILTALSVAIVAFIGAVGAYGVAAFNARTAQLKDVQQVAAVHAAAATAAGRLDTLIDQRKISVAQITPDSPVVQALVRDAIASVPDSVAAQKVTPESLARIVVGQVNTSEREPSPQTAPAPHPIPVSTIGQSP